MDTLRMNQNEPLTVMFKKLFCVIKKGCFSFTLSTQMFVLYCAKEESECSKPQTTSCLTSIALLLGVVKQNRRNMLKYAVNIILSSLYLYALFSCKLHFCLRAPRPSTCLCNQKRVIFSEYFQEKKLKAVKLWLNLYFYTALFRGWNYEALWCLLYGGLVMFVYLTTKRDKAESTDKKLQHCLW